MAWFTADAIEFFRELELNNNKEWFTANKERYQPSVQRPTEALAAAIIARVKPLAPDIATDPKKAAFRIYQDIRFCKDKTRDEPLAGYGLAGGAARRTIRRLRLVQDVLRTVEQALP